MGAGADRKDGSATGWVDGTGEDTGMKQSISFLLTTILLLTAPSFAEDRLLRVNFAPGAGSATRTEGIARGDTATFVLGAAQGQKMRIVCYSSENNVEFDVISPGGAQLERSRAKGDTQVWYGTLPHTGDYHVIVGTTRGSSEVTITFEIW